MNKRTRDSGSDLLFLIHGLGCSKETFHHIWDRPELESFSIVAVDLIGFGGSDAPEGFTYTMEAQAEACAELFAGYSERNIHIIAHSMGGVVGSLLPDAASFVNIEGNLIPEDCTASRKIVEASPEMYEERLYPYLQKKFRELGDRYAAIDETTSEAMRKSSESLVEWSDNGKALERFRALPCRKAYFYGENSPHRVALQHLSGIDTIEIADSGHFPMNDNPDVFYNALHRFVAGD